MTEFTNSQKLSWMNNLIIALEAACSVFAQKFKATGYEWIQIKTSPPTVTASANFGGTHDDIGVTTSSLKVVKSPCSLNVF
ncbi:MAG TPA: hypothetical protein VE089_01125 [Nitrososphaeraceae archaeon]|jgi:hypothetical protein|nr:hypothetical protein [Nitrososphaeraceae archaeon]